MKPTAINRWPAQMLALVLALFTLTLAARAQITWGIAQNISGDSDVITLGTLNYAYDWANSAQTVNGVAFAGANSADVGGNVGTTLSTVNNTAFTLGSGLFAALTPEYQGILVGSVYVSSASAYTVTFSNLISGHLYLVQFWVNDPRSAESSRTETLSSTGGNSVLLQFATGSGGGYPGQFGIGLFTASGTSQSLTIVGTSGSVPQMNAVQVRDVTGLEAWGGFQNATWDYASTNWGTGQSFATLTNTFPLVSFTDTNADGNLVTANVVSIQSAGVSIGLIDFANNAINYTLNSAAATPGITGATAVNVLGSGTVTLTGPNTYTGATVINNGTLVVSGSLGTGAVTVSGGTLNGTGAVNGPTAIQSGGQLSVGTSTTTGTLTLNNTLSLAGTTVLKLTKNGGTTVADKVTGMTTVTYGGTLVVTNISG